MGNAVRDSCGQRWEKSEKRVAKLVWTLDCIGPSSLSRNDYHQLEHIAQFETGSICISHESLQIQCPLILREIIPLPTDL